MSIDEKAYQHALAMNKGKTFSVEGGADECFRYFASCYEAAKLSEQPVSIKVAAKAAAKWRKGHEYIDSQYDKMHYAEQAAYRDQVKHIFNAVGVLYVD